MIQTPMLLLAKTQCKERSESSPLRPCFVNNVFGTDQFYITPIEYKPKNLVGYKNGELLFDTTIEKS